MNECGLRVEQSELFETRELCFRFGVLPLAFSKMHGDEIELAFFGALHVVRRELEVVRPNAEDVADLLMAHAGAMEAAGPVEIARKSRYAIGHGRGIGGLIEAKDRCRAAHQ